MTYQIQNIVSPPEGMTLIRDFRAYAVVGLAIYASPQPDEGEAFSVPLTKADFEDQQSHKQKTRDEVLQMLPEMLSYDKEIFNEFKETSDFASVRFDRDEMQWTVGPRPWEKTKKYLKDNK
jgi:hypothetical protein